MNPNNHDHRRALAFAAAALLVSAAAWFLVRPSAVVEPVEAPQAPDSAGVVPASPRPLSSESPAPEATPSVEPDRLDPPDTAEVREQVRENPHRTPPALIEFARQMATQMEEARKSPRSAQRLFEQLEDCVLEESQGNGPNPEPVRALCLANAQQLSKAFPSQLQPKYEALRSQTPEKIVQLVRALETQ